MYESVLADLKQRFGDKVLLSPQDIAPIIATSAPVQANLRSQKRFPIPIRKVGSKVGVTIYHLAEYLATGDVKVDASKENLSLSPTVRAKPVTSRRSRDWLLAFQTQIDFQFELVKEVEVFLYRQSLPSHEKKRIGKGKV